MKEDGRGYISEDSEEARCDKRGDTRRNRSKEEKDKEARKALAGKGRKLKGRETMIAVYELRMEGKGRGSFTSCPLSERHDRSLKLLYLCHR